MADLFTLYIKVELESVRSGLARLLRLVEQGQNSHRCGMKQT